MNNNKILITGAAGFIGHHLSKLLAKEGYTVIGLDNINDYYDPNLKLARLEDMQIDVSKIQYNIASEGDIIFYKLDLTDKENLLNLFEEYRFDYVVNIALVKNGKPQLGVIYVPDTKVLYYADVEKGETYKSILNSHSENLEEVSAKAKLIQANIGSPEKIKVVGSRSHMSIETEEFVDSLKKDFDEVEIVSKGSSLKFCLVAEGNADVYPRFAPTMEWDTAAGQAICEAVGLTVISKETNEPLLYNKENLLNPWFLVSRMK